MPLFDVLRMRLVLFLFMVVSLASVMMAQQRPPIQLGVNDTIVVQGLWYGDEWMMFRELEPVDIYAVLTEEQRNRRKEWYKLKRTVFLAYPYMKAIKEIINDINVSKLSIKNPRKLEAYLAGKEKELKEKFTDRLLNMTTYQGKILIKLIHREMGLTCFDIIKLQRGATTAITWQAFALLFGNSLTKKYEPKGEDMEMESLLIEAQKTYGF